jgi:hypothetical protein
MRADLSALAGSTTAASARFPAGSDHPCSLERVATKSATLDLGAHPDLGGVLDLTRDRCIKICAN